MMSRSKSRGSRGKIRSWSWSFKVGHTPFAAALLLNKPSANTNADQRAQLLEDKVAENAGTIEQLRQERALLLADHKELQHQFSKISEVSL